MNFDIESVVKTMLKAASGPLQKYWQTAAPVAETEFTKIAVLVQQIGIDRSTQTITQQDAADRIAMAQLATKAALDTQLGLATIAVEDAVNAALASVSGIVNGYLGLAVL